MAIGLLYILVFKKGDANKYANYMHCTDSLDFYLGSQKQNRAITENKIPNEGKYNKMHLPFKMHLRFSLSASFSENGWNLYIDLKYKIEGDKSDKHLSISYRKFDCKNHTHIQNKNENRP